MTSTFTVLPVPLDHLFSPGDDITSIVTEALSTIRWPDESTGITDGDIIVVTSKVVAKAEGRVVEAASRESVIDQQAERIVAVENTPRGITKSVQTSHGLVLAAAGVDTAMLSWWGRKDSDVRRDSQGVNTDLIVPAVLDAAAAHGVAATFATVEITQIHASLFDYRVPAPTAQRPATSRRRRRAGASPAAKTALAATVAVVVAVVVVAVAVCAWRRRRRRRQETYNSVELATKSLELSDLAVDESGAWIMDDVANPMR